LAFRYRPVSQSPRMYARSITRTTISCLQSSLLPLRRPQSMPGMMETVLNVGLCSKTIPGLIKKTGNERFVYDAYRRLIMMYSDVVMEKAEGIEPAEGKGIRKQLDEHAGRGQAGQGLQVRHRPDRRGPEGALRAVQAKVKEVLGKPFPDDPMEQLWGGIGRRVQELERQARRLLPPHRGHSRRVGHRRQRPGMVFGNMGDTRPPAWPSPATRPRARTSSTASGWSTPRARTWWPASARPTRSTTPPRTSRTSTCESLERRCPKLYKELDDIRAQAREALQGHAGHRVHDPGRQAVHAPVPQRQAHRHGRPEHGHGHAPEKLIDEKRTASCA
jgi:pyruvate, orthophosphate dikinase